VNYYYSDGADQLGVGLSALWTGRALCLPVGHTLWKRNTLPVSETKEEKMILPENDKGVNPATWNPTATAGGNAL